MQITKVVKEFEMELAESQNQRDKRVEELWRKLDPQGTNELDLNGLQKGLRRIDHPLKNADDMMKEIIQMVDSNNDGKIQYEEFRVFVEAAERQLLLLFTSIDRNHDGRVGPDELAAAFQKAGLSVPRRRLAGFFDEIDMNHDGYISFDEWRDFLLFMPSTNGSPLEAALSYYSSVVMLNAEGDSMVTEETLEGLGTTGFLLQALFGTRTTIPRRIGWLQPIPPIPKLQRAASLTAPPSPPVQSSRPLALQLRTSRSWTHQYDEDEETKTGLTQYLPEPGYFLAGALAGGVSRTATAPLDRIKVALLVATGATNGGGGVKSIGAAVRELYKAGGIRTFFAGNGLNVLKIMPETAIKFGSYEAAKRTLATLEGHSDPTKINPYSKFVAGGFAGMAAQACVYPVDTLKFRLQCETVQGGPTGNALLVQTARKMVVEGGFRSAYRGLTMGLVGMFPYSAIDMGTFEFLKKSYTIQKARYYGIHEEDAAPGNLITGFIGACSGAFGATAVYPINVLRTRLQTQGTRMHPPTYTGIWDVTCKTWKNEGFRGMYKGLTPNLLKVAPALSITWVVYESSKRTMGLH
ncbi:hypothetical protein M406DRAFT_78329 [Cryphonectria parasitica EP155]|uniref:Mitochondrial thiamine pyrophosphate carrier 1 n=1 Tax=Cryphonectria parasitica (strain ATCC 38755 / EP155) TaxID=660469 RepID=A0A9P4Y2S7_CRYP1|nr:uncharacterized protein M406DRAFT_78329 [Cryphonectria parasitica EP155]KAF3765521.1 hypothetical protein M406DRAFT_78329 [Cryphonectria parasitica EP155]